MRFYLSFQVENIFEIQTNTILFHSFDVFAIDISNRYSAVVKSTTSFFEFIFNPNLEKTRVLSDRFILNGMQGVDK